MPSPILLSATHLLEVLIDDELVEGKPFIANWTSPSRVPVIELQVGGGIEALQMSALLSPAWYLDPTPACEGKQRLFWQGETTDLDYCTSR